MMNETLISLLHKESMNDDEKTKHFATHKSYFEFLFSKNINNTSNIKYQCLQLKYAEYQDCTSKKIESVIPNKTLQDKAIVLINFIC